VIRCIPDIGSLLCPLEEVIVPKLLPNLTGQCAFNDVERDLLSLPPRFGGLDLINPSKYSTSQFASSVSITAPLVDLVVQQSFIYSVDVLELQKGAKQQVLSAQCQLLLDVYDQLLPALSPSLKCSVLLSSVCEKGSSNWLNYHPTPI